MIAIGRGSQQDHGRRRPRDWSLIHGSHSTLGSAIPMSETITQQQWICTSCGYVYDPDEGDPDGGIPAGTAFEEIPDNWFCPVCGARKADFEPLDE